MEKKKRVLVIGLEPTLVDFSHIPDLNAEKVMAALKADQAKLNALGYDTQLCFTDLGRTAEAVVLRKLSESTFDCIVIGAGIRTLPTHFLLFDVAIEDEWGNVITCSPPHSRILD